MITVNNSVANILERIIYEIEVETISNKNISRLSTKRKLEDIGILSRKNKRARYETDDVEDIHCRICYDSSQQFPIVYPCKCKGTMGAVHVKCLEHWLEESNRNSCELCGHVFQVERTPRYKAVTSVIIWLCVVQHQRQLYMRNLRTDLLRCIIVTPMTIICSYICVVGADFYAANNYNNFPPARWTTYSLLIMMALLIFSYFLWIYIAVENHQKIWFYWWQKTSAVKITLPSQNRTSINYKSNISQV
ncbi:hypothetical protein M0802_007467 [Mischocyttarus mexicanus]|nr:hypothetical protein M0802_007467 [Mischocyttarus mexicanus]